MDNLSFHSNCKQYAPTKNELTHFLDFVTKSFKDGAHHEGIAKVKFPVNLDKLETVVDRVGDLPISIHQQFIEKERNGNTICDGLFNLKLANETKMSLKGFLANYKSLFPATYDDQQISDYNLKNMESRLWKAVDVEFTACVDDIPGNILTKILQMESSVVKSWDPNEVRSILHRVPVAESVKQPYLRTGTLGSVVGWHAIAQDLLSANVHVGGAPRIWYTLPMDQIQKFKQTVASLIDLEERYGGCPAVFTHKDILTSPIFLAKNDIKFNRIIQFAGDIILTYPKGYHMILNLGFNIIEAVDFGVPESINYGLFAQPCSGMPNTVQIPMVEFLEASNLNDKQSSQPKHNSSKVSFRTEHATYQISPGAAVEVLKKDETGASTSLNVCPECHIPDDDVQPLIGCELCNDFYHFKCVGITHTPPEEEPWFCQTCEHNRPQECEELKSKKGK